MPLSQPSVVSTSGMLLRSGIVTLANLLAVSYGLSAIVRRADTPDLSPQTINMPFFGLLIALGLVNGLVLALMPATRPAGMGILLGTGAFTGMLGVLLFMLAASLS